MKSVMFVSAALMLSLSLACSKTETTTTDSSTTVETTSTAATSDNTMTDSAAMSTDTTMTTATSTTGSAAGDTDFVTKAANGGMAEVELGTLAQQNASSADVKAFGKMMVDDHSKANDELKGLAASKNITLPTAINSEEQALKDKLSALKGKEFDKAYVDAMVEDHTKDVADFQTESSSGTDQQVKDWAAKTLPTLQKHLTKIQEIQGKLK